MWSRCLHTHASSLDRLEPPDVDSIEGLSPAISIEQKSSARSPRSTVGTVTEIYDYLRLLFASIRHAALSGVREADFQTEPRSDRSQP